VGGGRVSGRARRGHLLSMRITERVPSTR
jgi:hypothetical protein